MSNKAILEIDAPGRCVECRFCHGRADTLLFSCAAYGDGSGRYIGSTAYIDRAPFCPLQIMEHGEYPVEIDMKKIRRRDAIENVPGHIDDWIKRYYAEKQEESSD